MSTASAVRRPARANKAEERFVDDLAKIVLPVLERMPPAEREERMRKAKEYLSSLGENVPKHA
jgi:hypothetical protein